VPRENRIVRDEICSVCQAPVTDFHRQTDAEVIVGGKRFHRACHQQAQGQFDGR
jgi:hypothetical protein